MKTKIKNISRLLGTLLLAAVIVQGCSDVAGPNSQVLSESINPSFNANESQGIDGTALDTEIDDGKQQGKIYVCKYVRTPNDKKGGGEWEVLKNGNQGLVHVSPNSIRKEVSNSLNGTLIFPTVNIGNWWQDAHTLSVVIDPQVGFNALYADGSREAVQTACENARSAIWAQD